MLLFAGTCSTNGALKWRQCLTALLACADNYLMLCVIKAIQSLFLDLFSKRTSTKWKHEKYYILSSVCQCVCIILSRFHDLNSKVGLYSLTFFGLAFEFWVKIILRIFCTELRKWQLTSEEFATVIFYMIPQAGFAYLYYEPFDSVVTSKQILESRMLVST